jgi:hypothetical protein
MESKMNKPEPVMVRVLNYFAACDYIVEKYNLPTFNSLFDEKYNQGKDVDPNRDAPDRALWLLICDCWQPNNGDRMDIDFYNWYEEDVCDNPRLADTPAYMMMKLLIDEFELAKEENSDLLWEFSW